MTSHISLVDWAGTTARTWNYKYDAS